MQTHKIKIKLPSLVWVPGSWSGSGVRRHLAFRCLGALPAASGPPQTREDISKDEYSTHESSSPHLDSETHANQAGKKSEAFLCAWAGVKALRSGKT
jgi:hypothetical protein